MRVQLVRAAATAVVAGMLAAGIFSTGAQAADGMKMSGWLPYWLMNTSTTDAVSNSDLFEDVSPFWFDAQVESSKTSSVGIMSNSLSWGTRPAILSSLQQNGIKVLPSITDGTPARHMASVLATPDKRTAFVGQITALVNNNGYDGIDLDFEKFAFNDGQQTWATTKPAWVGFIAELATSLHATGKLLSVSVPPMYSDTSGYWVYAFRELAPHIDKLRIMAYDYSWDSAGPIGGPLTWVRTVLGYAVDAAPASKVYLGTPTYGRDWVTSSSGAGCPATFASRTYNSSEVTFTDEWVRSTPSMERTRTYTEAYNATCTVSRTAWMPDSQTTLARWKVAQEFGIAGLAQWMVGTEQSGQWDLLRSEALQPPTPAPDPQPLPVSEVPPVVNPPAAPVRGKVSPVEIWLVKKGRSAVTIKGKFAAAGVRKVTIYRKINGKFRKVARARTTAGGKFTVRFTLPGKTLKLRAGSTLGSSQVLIVKR